MASEPGKNSPSCPSSSHRTRYGGPPSSPCTSRISASRSWSPTLCALDDQTVANCCAHHPLLRFGMTDASRFWRSNSIDNRAERPSVTEKHARSAQRSARLSSRSRVEAGNRSECPSREALDRDLDEVVAVVRDPGRPGADGEDARPSRHPGLRGHVRPPARSIPTHDPKPCCRSRIRQRHP